MPEDADLRSGVRGNGVEPEPGPTGGDGPAAVTVRLTESAERGLPSMVELRRSEATIAFDSLPAAYGFAERLNRHTDGVSYYLAPDHAGPATFMLNSR